MGYSYQSSSMPLIHCYCLMNDGPKESCFILCLMFVPNDVPPWRDRRRNFVLPFFRNWFLHCSLSHNPLRIMFARVCQEMNNLMPPPMCQVKENLNQLTIKHVELCVGPTMAICPLEPVPSNLRKLWRVMHPGHLVSLL